MAIKTRIGSGFLAHAAFMALAIGSWCGQAPAQCPEWHPLTWSGQVGVNGIVHALVVWNGDLIAGGDFTTAGGQTVNRIARWDGSAWYPLIPTSAGGAPIGLNGTVSALTVWNGDLIVGGDFGAAGGIAVSNIARWDGSFWHPFIAPGFNIGVNGHVRALTVHQGNLVAGGDFTTAGGVLVNRIARWNGANWQAFTSGGQIGLGIVAALATWNGDLVAGGDFIMAGGQTARGIARWTGAAWQPISAGGLQYVDNGIPLDIIVQGGQLIVGGLFWTADGVTMNHIASWDGTWHAYTSGGQIGLANDVYALLVHGGELYAGGPFATAGGQTVNRIARWDGEAWHPIVSGGQTGVNGGVLALTEYGGHVIAGGAFTTAGGMTVNRIARWGSDVADVFITQPQHTVAAEGAVAMLSVEVVNSGTVTEYIWRKDGIALSDDDRISGSGTAVLTIDPVEPGDHGVYDVLVSYPCGTWHSALAALGVAAAPPCPGDLNNDGTVDVLDLLILLGAWGACR